MLRLITAAAGAVLPAASAVGTFMGPWAAIATVAAGVAGAGFLWRRAGVAMRRLEALEQVPDWIAALQDLDAAHADTRAHLEAIAAELGARAPRPTRHIDDLRRARALRIRPRTT